MLTIRYHGKCLKVGRSKMKLNERFVCSVCDWRQPIQRDAPRAVLEDLEQWYQQAKELPLLPEELQLLEDAIDRAGKFRGFLRTILAQPLTDIRVARFYLRKLEGAEIMLLSELNTLRSEAHRLQPVAPQAPPLLEGEVHQASRVKKKKEVAPSGTDANASDRAPPPSVNSVDTVRNGDDLQQPAGQSSFPQLQRNHEDTNRPSLPPVIDSDPLRRYQAPAPDAYKRDQMRLTGFLNPVPAPPPPPPQAPPPPVEHIQQQRLDPVPSSSHAPQALPPLDSQRLPPPVSMQQQHPIYGSQPPPPPPPPPPSMTHTAPTMAYYGQDPLQMRHNPEARYGYGSDRQQEQQQSQSQNQQPYGR